MSQNLTKQIENAVNGCCAFGDSKRADKFNDAIDTSWKIYSDNSKDDILVNARCMGKFIRKHYPEITRAYQINSDVIQAFINSKPSTCRDDTMWKYISYIKKTEICLKRVYFRYADKFDWNVDNVIVPQSAKEGGYMKDTPVPIDVARYTISELRKHRSEALNSARLSTFAGMRAKETVMLKAGNVHLSGGEFGFGWIQIVKGPAGGAKGGRPRVIPLINQEAHDAIKSAVAGKKPDDYVVSKDDGTNMTPDNARDMIAEVMDAKYGRTYLGNRNHGMRKTWSQFYYDTVRPHCDRKKAISKTNTVIGHGHDRGPQGIKSYVKNMW